MYNRHAFSFIFTNDTCLSHDCSLAGVVYTAMIKSGTKRFGKRIVRGIGAVYCRILHPMTMVAPEATD
jgi:hypothetical protein